MSASFKGLKLLCRLRVDMDLDEEIARQIDLHIVLVAMWLSQKRQGESLPSDYMQGLHKLPSMVTAATRASVSLDYTGPVVLASTMRDMSNQLEVFCTEHQIDVRSVSKLPRESISELSNQLSGVFLSLVKTASQVSVDEADIREQLRKALAKYLPRRTSFTSTRSSHAAPPPEVDYGTMFAGSERIAPPSAPFSSFKPYATASLPRTASAHPNPIGSPRRSSLVDPFSWPGSAYPRTLLNLEGEDQNPSFGLPLYTRSDSRHAMRPKPINPQRTSFRAGEYGSELMPTPTSSKTSSYTDLFQMDNPHVPGGSMNPLASAFQRISLQSPTSASSLPFSVAAYPRMGGPPSYHPPTSSNLGSHTPLNPFATPSSYSDSTLSGSPLPTAYEATLPAGMGGLFSPASNGGLADLYNAYGYGQGRGSGKPMEAQRMLTVTVHRARGLSGQPGQRRVFYCLVIPYTSKGDLLPRRQTMPAEYQAHWNEVLAFPVPPNGIRGVHVELEAGGPSRESLGTGSFDFGTHPQEAYQEVEVVLERFQRRAGHVVLSLSIA